MKFYLLFTLFILCIISCKKKDFGNDPVIIEYVADPPIVVVNEVDHSIWNSLLNSYVDNNGDVDYQGLKTNDIVALNNYLTLVKSVVLDNTYSNDEKLAYWINVYNAFTVKLVVDFYPVTSITQIANGSPWDTTFIAIGSNNYSLNNIEHNIIRQDFNEPRIHFGVNCASVSCPKLHNQAFTGNNIDSLLNILTSNFINNTTKNIITTNPLQLSEIFNWYQVDFIGSGTLINYLNQYSLTAIPNATPITYLPYDWNLNKQ